MNLENKETKINLDPLNIFEGRFVINLANKKQRLSNFYKRTEGLLVERFDAVPHQPRIKEKNAFGYPRKYIHGASFSHQEIIRVAKERQYETVVVFEDDAMFYNYDAEILKRAIKSLELHPWEIFRLSYTRRGVNGLKRGRSALKKLTPYTFSNTYPRDVFCNFACVVYHKRAFPSILNDFDPCEHPTVDAHFPVHYFNIYLNPLMVIQASPQAKKANLIHQDKQFRKTHSNILSFK